MSNFIVKVTATLLALGMAVTACASSQSDLLQVLGDTLEKVRASPGTEPVSVAPLPDVQLLQGVTRQQLWSALGRPSNCMRQPEVECEEAQTWSYDFFLLPDQWRGGGSTLVLGFAGKDSIESAMWKWSR